MVPMSVVVRPACAADLPTIVEFNQRMARETEGLELDPAVLSRGVAAALADPAKGTYLMAELSGAVAGQLMYTTEWSDWRDGWFWWIQSVYVREAARRHGVFRALYAAVGEHARAAGDVIGLRLYVEEHNARAQETYAKQGMSRTHYLVFEECPLPAGMFVRDPRGGR